jgi:ribose 5-phosphate isomerase B
MKIFIGSDHAGFEFKAKLITHLTELGHEVEDKGAFTFDKDDDYPDFIFPTAEGVAQNEGSRGIVIGGSGFGEAMAANRVKGARALVFYGPMLPKGAVDVSGRESHDPYELIKLSRMHNDANIISFGMRFITEDEAKHAINVFLGTEFPGDERHIRRIKKLDQHEE